MYDYVIYNLNTYKSYTYIYVYIYVCVCVCVCDISAWTGFGIK